MSNDYDPETTPPEDPDTLPLWEVLELVKSGLIEAEIEGDDLVIGGAEWAHARRQAYPDADPIGWLLRRAARNDSALDSGGGGDIRPRN